MPKTIVHTDAAPKAIGPYSQAVRAGDFAFLSGQIPLDPATGEIVPGDVSAQTKRVMENLSAVLVAVGGSFDRVVKTTIYLQDLGDFAAVNAVYGAYFTKDPPARATVQVAALPRGSRVEIDAVVFLGALDPKRDRPRNEARAETKRDNQDGEEIGHDGRRVFQEAPRCGSGRRALGSANGGRG